MHFGNIETVFTMVKHVFRVNGLGLETKQMWLNLVKSCATRNWRPLSQMEVVFFQPQMFFQQCCFHEIRFDG